MTRGMSSTVALDHRGWSGTRLNLSHLDVWTVWVSQCVNLTEVLLPTSLKDLDDNAFAGCPALLRLDLSHTQLESAGDDLLRDCTALTEVLLPPSLKTLGSNAFQMCTSLQRIDLSRTQLEDVGDDLLIACPALTEVLLPPSLKRLVLRVCRLPIVGAYRPVAHAAGRRRRLVAERLHGAHGRAAAAIVQDTGEQRL
jgi:hypothetical protein